MESSGHNTEHQDISPHIHAGNHLKSGYNAPPAQGQEQKSPTGQTIGTEFTKLDPTAKPPRTLGLKVFDNFLYTFLTNTSVFGISVLATYLTSRGGVRNDKGELVFGKVGNFFFTRGEKLKGTLTKAGMTEEQADMSKMVAFSFLDGSAMAPVVKVFEDHREEIGRKIDRALGTEPEDDSVYAAEPKQSWSSVLLGRFLTAGIVVPTAVFLDKQGLNKTLFNDPGLKVGEHLAKKEFFQKQASWLDVKEISRVSIFEAFYTSVCTMGLYVTSRTLARIPWLGGTKQSAATAPESGSSSSSPHFTHAAASAPQSLQPEQQAATPAQDTTTPKTRISTVETQQQKLHAHTELAL